jgi:hypothetical protein
LVYLGPKVPSYAISNYFSISKTFPDYEVWFVVDASKTFDSLIRKGIRAWKAPKKLPGSLNSRNTFRNGFWSSTTNRFYAMLAFHQSHSDQSILQVESDVIIFPGFPMAMFDQIEQKLAFPMSSPDTGLASTLWVKNLSGSKLLTDFTDKQLEIDSNVTDTEILGRLSKSHPGDVLVLRSGPSSASAYRDSQATNRQTLQGDLHSINDFGIFDASTLGIHLCGSDPRNTFGKSFVFDPLPHHYLHVKKLKISVVEERLVASVGEEHRDIYSLHNHSKNRAFFDSDFNRKLGKDLKKRDLGIQNRFSVFGLISCLHDYLNIVLWKIRRLKIKEVI